jgi:hypothetical protein
MALSPATRRPRVIHDWTVFARAQSCALVGKSPRFAVGDNVTLWEDYKRRKALTQKGK